MLTVRGLSWKLAGGRTLLDNVSFSVREGEFVGILGPSGAGKTLTIRAIVGLTAVQSGECVFTGEDGNDCDTIRVRGEGLRIARRQIGMIFQGLQLVKRLTALENVMIGRLGRVSPLRSWLYGFTDGEAREAMQVLDRVGMAAFADRITASLSGGEMQHVAVARAIFQQPRLYLADEPIANLDPGNASEIMRLLQSLSREALVVGAFHQPEMTSRFCTRVIGIRQGAVVYDGPPRLTIAQLREIYGAELEGLRGAEATHA